MGSALAGIDIQTAMPGLAECCAGQPAVDSVGRTSRSSQKASMVCREVSCNAGILVLI